MKVGRKPTTGAVVLNLLETIGPMSAREIADYLGVAIQNINCAFRVMREAHELRGEPKLVYVKDWEFPARPNGGRENAVWARGDLPCKKRPKRNKAEVESRYKTRKRVIARVARTAPGNHFASLIAQVTA
ncbi:hypothetical protein WK15_11685 [Burkholderia ubonensis]|uniref:hypothetical protein n=1 Tax=Burkholderia ubonensis TaxID=101571 RepID=UPI0007528006|nr:hypothetical protein [Burkholderia ubonensis]KVR27820.1 hypothetical protein WK15_11685 [Burkholderia ubonensis]KWB93981.1 hypothetical protein WL45_15700 [Burkholderia ubonensis]KWC17438.1 hypothetical protein WL46_26595 [Burkholderia ubonensis]